MFEVEGVSVVIGVRRGVHKPVLWGQGSRQRREHHAVRPCTKWRDTLAGGVGWVLWVNGLSIYLDTGVSHTR